MCCDGIIEPCRCEVELSKVADPIKAGPTNMILQATDVAVLWIFKEDYPCSVGDPAAGGCLRATRQFHAHEGPIGLDIIPSD
jgi:hypothetical protein